MLFLLLFLSTVVFSSNVRFPFFELVLQVHTYIKPEYHNLPRQKLAPGADDVTV